MKKVNVILILLFLMIITAFTVVVLYLKFFTTVVDYKIYKNERYSFKYFETWSVKRYQGLGSYSTNISFDSTEQNEVQIIAGGIPEAEKDKTKDDFVNEISNSLGGQSVETLETKEVELSGLSATRKVIKSNSTGEKILLVFCIDSENYYLIAYGDNEEDFALNEGKVNMLIESFKILSN